MPDRPNSDWHRFPDEVPIIAGEYRCRTYDEVFGQGYDKLCWTGEKFLLPVDDLSVIAWEANGRPARRGGEEAFAASDEARLTRQSRAVSIAEQIVLRTGASSLEAAEHACRLLDLSDRSVAAVAGQTAVQVLAVRQAETPVPKTWLVSAVEEFEPDGKGPRLVVVQVTAYSRKNAEKAAEAATEAFNAAHDTGSPVTSTTRALWKIAEVNPNRPDDALRLQAEFAREFAETFRTADVDRLAEELLSKNKEPHNE